jgi:pyruvate/2-oxoacid:ferredoxin oxidoreductase alpha subunit
MSDQVRYELLSGNRMLADGALQAGCRFFSGYPIIPSSEIYETMIRELPAGTDWPWPPPTKSLRWRIVWAPRWPVIKP